ncbi:SgcJ/EcaC family oxidoreductase [Aeoliella sp. ICT_H6.2]|uniref:SgcJ/EcaC family oxidoreductase n=1 Tax=Aeoliella straminimaris TaxID=2954799 RepID=A0A9X2FHB0_9BACT|nr:SgcJ/EcaC family oxidoreductase [Aeoliella straminimaris]MCO6045831.1 SgcJ/EcaC family oxidoreductase [Aeoliella straminimaris]
MAPKLILFVLAFVLPLSQAWSAETDRPQDEAAIKQVIDKKTDGFNRHNAAAQAMLFTEGADFYASNGTVHVVGRDKIEGVFKFIHEGENAVFKNAKLDQTVSKIAFLSPDIAIVSTDLTVNRAEKDGGTYSSRGLRVMVRQDGQWKIRTYMNQLIVPSRVSPEDIETATEGESSQYRFTHSTVVLSKPWQEVIHDFEDSTMQTIRKAGGIEFGIWHSIPLEEGSPAPEMSPQTLIVTIAWPKSSATNAVAVTDEAFNDFSATRSVRTRLYEPVVLPHGMTISTGQGFYVHRLNQYSSDNVERVTELSQKAWLLMDQPYGEVHSVIGLFREVPDRDGVATLMRIVWYPSFQGWQKTRGAKDEVPEAIELFEERGKMAIGNPFGEGTVTGRYTHSDRLGETVNQGGTPPRRDCLPYRHTNYREAVVVMTPRCLREGVNLRRCSSPRRLRAVRKMLR